MVSSAEIPTAPSPAPFVDDDGRRERPSVDALRYRFGFCAHEPGAIRERAAVALQRLGWARRDLGPLALWTHPEATLRVIEAGAAIYAFVGDVYVEAADGGGSQVVLEHRLRAVAPGDDALYALLDTLAGRFALLVIEGPRVRTFHDAMGARTVFYHDRRPFAVASHAQLLGEALGAEQCPDVAGHCANPGFSSRKTNSLPGDRTAFRDIHALVPNNLFDSEPMRTLRYWPRGPRREAGLGTFRDRLDASMAALGRYVRGRCTPVLGLTGGVDTRVVMAAFRRDRIPFETVTWKVAKLPPHERVIIDQLRATLAAPHVFAEKSPDLAKISAICRRNAQPHRKRSSVAAAAWAVYGDRPEALFLRGYGGEIIRGFYNLGRLRMLDLSPAEMARMYFSPKGAAPPPDTIGFFEDYFRRGNYDGLEAMGFDPNDIFYWEHRMGMWGAVTHNELDVAMRSIPTYNSRSLFEAAWGLPAEVRLKKRILAQAVSRYDRALGRVSISRTTREPGTGKKANGNGAQPG